MNCKNCQSILDIEEGRYMYYKSLDNIVYCSKICHDNFKLSESIGGSKTMMLYILSYVAIIYQNMSNFVKEMIRIIY